MPTLGAIAESAAYSDAIAAHGGDSRNGRWQCADWIAASSWNGPGIPNRADAGYLGAEKRDEVIQAQTDGALQADITWHIAARRSPIKKMADGLLKDLVQQIERAKAQIRARVEHPFHVFKNLFKHKKARYKGLARNTAQLFSLFGLANLVLAKSRVMALDTQGAS